MNIQCDSCKYFLLEKYSLVKGICMYHVLNDTSQNNTVIRTYMESCEYWDEKKDGIEYQNIIKKFMRKTDNKIYYIRNNLYEADYA